MTDKGSAQKREPKKAQGKADRVRHEGRGAQKRTEKKQKQKEKTLSLQPICGVPLRTQ